MIVPSEHYGTVMMIEDRGCSLITVAEFSVGFFFAIMVKIHWPTYTMDLLTRHYTKQPMAVPGILEAAYEYVLIYPCQPGQYGGLRSIECKLQKPKFSNKYSLL